MTAVKKRIVGHATPNEYPRQPIESLLMMQLAAIQAAGANAAVELRGFGLHGLADSLTAEIEKIRIIHTAARNQVPRTVTIPVEMAGEPDE